MKCHDGGCGHHYLIGGIFVADLWEGLKTASSNGYHSWIFRVGLSDNCFQKVDLKCISPMTLSLKDLCSNTLTVRLE